MGDLAEMRKDPIFLRKARLKDLINGKQRRRESGFSPSPGTALEENDLSSETLVDAFTLLYDECTKLRKSNEPYMKFFLNKYGSTVTEIQNLQLTLKDFRICDMIRRGAFGNFHLGKERSKESICVIKVMDKFQPNMQRMLSSIDTEFKILSKAASEWIVDFKYSFQDPKRIYFVQEYVSDEDMLTCLERNGGVLEEEDAKFYLAETVLAINALHSMGFVHRDLRPANIMLDKMGHVKLTDFSSASRLSQGKVTTPLTVGFETRPYVAPEVLLSLEDNEEALSQLCYGTECDYWSLGVMAYELVYGKTPFAGESSLATFNNIISHKPPLEFPRSPVSASISDEFKLFVTELLGLQAERIGFEEVLRHAVFYHIIWDSIRTEVPPYIPKTKDEAELGKLLLKEFTDAPADPPAALPLRHVGFVGFTKTLKSGIGGAAPGSYQMNRTFNASSSLLETSDTSFMEDKDDTSSRLQAELNAKTEILLERTKDLKVLESKLSESCSLVSEKDAEIAKLCGELKRAKCEIGQLNRDLNEEREVRQQLKDQSVELVTDIKASQKRKIAELETGLEYQRSIVTKRESYISELETEITNLRTEVQNCQREIQKAQTATGQLQQKTAKSYRGSISMMESRLQQNSNELEEKIKEMNVQHEEELLALQSALKRHEEDMSNLLSERDLEIDHLKGRLEESRSSREETLEEMRLMRKKYDGTIKKLEKCVEELVEKNERLENEKDCSSSSSGIQEMLQHELDETRKEKTRLSLELEQINRESKVRQEKIDELDRIVKRLEGSLEGMEAQKSDLMNKMKELFQRGQDADVEKGASHILQEQLEKMQLNLDSTKELLFQEREKVKALEKSMSTLEMSHNEAKVDLRIALREKKELDEKLKNQRAELEGNSEKVKSIEDVKKELEKKVYDLEQEVMKLGSKIEGDAFELKEMKTTLADKNNDIKKLEGDSTKAAEEIANLKVQLQEFDKLKAKYEKRAGELKEKDRIIEERCRKITNLITNVDVLKQALNVLDEQLKEFETAIAQRTSDLEAAQKAKTSLESENNALKDEMKKLKCEINESKSLRLFTEQRLREVESSMKTSELAKTTEVKLLKEKLEFMTEKSQELSEDLDTVSARFEENEVAKEYLTKQVENLRKESAVLKEESSRTITQLVKLKESNIQLSSGLEEAINKCEAYKNRVDSMNEDLLVLECEKNESETKLQSMLQQQIKLIEYLQNQNEALSVKKKKTFADRIFGRKENEPITPAPTFIPTPMKETPRRVLQEQNAVKNLEAEANKLKAQLAMLQKEKENRAQVEAEPEPVFEEVKRHEVPMKMERTPSSPMDRDSEDILKLRVYEESGTARAQISCIKHVFGELFLLGCEDGLFSTKIVDNQPRGKVKINGAGPVKQIDFISRQNIGLMIEGENRGLVSVHLGLLRSCAEAAACSKAKVTLHTVHDQIQKCHLFQVQKTTARDTVLIVATDTSIRILFWEQDSFSLRKTVTTPIPIKGIITTPNSIIFGYEKIFELDITNFVMEEFIDESDDSLFYVTTSSQELSSYPIAILDVGMSNLGPGETNYSTEYLLCFPDLAIFVDGFGRRSRPVDIVWSKLPVEVTYRHPDLFVVHMGSIEIIRLNKNSYTKTRVGVTQDSIGTEVLNIPESHFIYFNSPHFLGTGLKSGSIIVSTESRNSTQLFDIWLDESVTALSISNPSLPFDSLSSLGSIDSQSLKSSMPSDSDLSSDLYMAEHLNRARYNNDSDTD